MTGEEFDQIAAPLLSEKPDRFDLTPFKGSLGDELPVAYADFLRRYGEGYFAYVLILPPTSLDSGRFLACGDDQCGGYYGFLANGSGLGEAIFYWYPAETDPPKRVFSSFFEFAVELGLRGPGLLEKARS